uniref:Uncharacterized protein n=1 Tax=Amphimedon queenslandica TaxID=400682 RepID=A0A1X7T4Y9_AMPQE
SFCHLMTAHWFAQLSWFWDPSKEWVLPTRCYSCKTVIDVNTFPSNIPNNVLVKVTCPHCYDSFTHQIQHARGDPRNIAFIGHWDGWQPFSTSIKHSCGGDHLAQCEVGKFLSSGGVRACRRDKLAERSSNKKNLEISFAKAESRREFMKFFNEVVCTTTPATTIPFK